MPGAQATMSLESQPRPLPSPAKLAADASAPQTLINSSFDNHQVKSKTKTQKQAQGQREGDKNGDQRSPSSVPAPDKVFICPTCKRKFNKKANLKVHSRKHTGEKPYACSRPGCGKRFMWKSSVSFHEQNCNPTQASTQAFVLSRQGYMNSDVTNRTAPPAAPARSPGSSKKRAAPSPPHPVQMPPRKRRFDDSSASPKSISQPDALGKQEPTGTFPARPPHQPQQSLGRPPQLPTSSSAAVMRVPQPIFAPPSSAAQQALPTTPLPSPASLTMRPPLSRPPAQGNYSSAIPIFCPAGGYEGQRGPKAPFDLKISSSSDEGTRRMGTICKMPIKMELDSDDEDNYGKTGAAQNAFLSTGNLFGYAPLTRCSPMPVSSPIVCPQLSPMPLSPLAPFSPLPPDSPQALAPNPVHPPLMQSSTRVQW